MPHSDKTAAHSDAGDDTIDLLSLFQVLWRGRRLIAGFVGAAALIGGIYAYFLAVPVYQAHSVVMLETRKSASLGIESVLGALSSDNSTVNTEVEVLKGRKLMGRVVEAMNLEQDLEFNPELNLRSLRKRIGTILGMSGAVPDSEGVHDKVVTALLEHIQISNTPNSLVFQISVKSISPQKAAALADKIAELYIDDQLLARFDATSAATIWLSEQVSVQKKAYEAAYAEVRKFRADSSVVDAEGLAALDRQIKDNRRRIEQTDQRRNELDRQIAASDIARPDLIADRERLTEQAVALRDAEKLLSADYERQSQELTQLEQLEREAESSQLLYEHFQSRMKEIAAQQGINQADSRILSKAVVPTFSVEPRRPLIIIMSALLGLVVSSGLVFLNELRANKIRSRRELEEVTGHTVLAQIPLVVARTRNGVIDYLARNPASAAAEAVRNLRTSLLFSSNDNPPRVIATTSSVPGEGKTTTTVALAQNLTKMGKKVLVIEGDVRMRTLESYAVGTSATVTENITSLLLGHGSLASAVHSIDGVGDMILGGKSDVNAADLFSTQRFAELLAEAKEIYDMVLVDTPPVLVVPDARIIAQHVDGVIFVSHWDRTTREQVAESMLQLKNLHIPIIGLVLTCVDPKKMREYGYGESYGAYASYGERYYSSDVT